MFDLLDMAALHASVGDKALIRDFAVRWISHTFRSIAFVSG